MHNFEKGNKNSYLPDANFTAHKKDNFINTPRKI